MTLKACPCCKLTLTTKNVVRKGRNLLGIYVNCRKCGSTALLRAKDWKARMLGEGA